MVAIASLAGDDAIELVWGLVFGGTFAAIVKGRHLAGAISGSILWSVVPLLCPAADAVGYARVTHKKNPHDEDLAGQHFPCRAILADTSLSQRSTSRPGCTLLPR
jgi:hypothetical protein